MERYGSYSMAAVVPTCANPMALHNSSTSAHRTLLHLLWGGCLFCTTESQDSGFDSCKAVVEERMEKKKRRRRAVCTESLLSLPDTLPSSCSGDYDLWRSLHVVRT